MTSAITNGWARLGAPMEREALRDDQATALRRLVAESAPRERHAAQAHRRSRTVAIASGKGGVGKTSLCVNLAIALSRRGLRVTLLDADLGLANADVLCGVRVLGHLGHVLSGSRTVSDIAIETPQGFTLLPGAAGLSALTDLPDASLSLLLEGLSDIERNTDIVLIDCGAGIGRHVLAFLGAADLCLVATTPEPTAITDAYALCKVALGHGQAGQRDPCCDPHLMRLLVNQAHDEREAAATHRRIADVCDRFLGSSPPLIGWIAKDEAVARAVRTRRPFVESSPRRPASRGVVRLAGAVHQQLRVEATGAPREGFFRRVFGLSG